MRLGSLEPNVLPSKHCSLVKQCTCIALIRAKLKEEIIKVINLDEFFCVGVEEAGLCRISKEEIVKEKDRLGHFGFILIKTLCPLNTHTRIKWRGKQ